VLAQYFRRLGFSAAIVAAVGLLAQPLRAEPQSAELRAEHDRLSARLAEAIPDWRPERPASGSLLFVAPDSYSATAGQDDRFRVSRDEYAASLFALAIQAAEVGEHSLAFQWATEAVRENPDHAEARRVLGYEERDGQWLTGYGLRMADAGKAWHPKYGWVALADVPRYEAGERLVGTRWLSADDDAARRKAIKNGWQIRTDHFLVTTNDSLQAAADFAARLERLHQVWRQLFAGFYLTEREVRALFAGERQPRRQIRPFRVYYQENRDQYNSALRRRQPRIAETLGIYFDANREAHFFAGPEPNMPTLYHEAVHQLFQESKTAAKRVASQSNFWIVEGVATYFETLTEHVNDDAGLYYTVGQSTAGRLPAARERLLDGFYIPLAELTQLGKSDLQEHPEIAKLYSQAAGLSAFLMDGEQGRYREKLIRYLGAVYAGRDTARSLADIAEVSYQDLDWQYRRYIQSLP
jgi:hypothetical protein